MLSKLVYQPATSNILHVTHQLLNSLGVEVTQTSVKETIENHPDYPSLLSISDSLGVWGIVSKCYKVSNDKFALLPVPFITNIADNGSVFVTVTAVTSSSISYLHPFRENTVTESVEAFQQKWNGITLIVEAVNLKKEKDFEQKQKNEKLRALTLPFIFSSCIVLLLLYVIAAFQAVFLSPLLLSGLAVILFAGCAVTAVLLFYEIDNSNPFIQQICSAAGKANCATVLQSRGAKIFNWLSWSEIGFFYFAGSFLLLLTGGIQTASLLMIAVLNALALPYCFFSVYYQWRVVKEWCPLCLAIQALLIMQFVLCYFLVWTHINNIYITITASQITVLFTSYVIPIVFWTYSKKYFLKAKAGEDYKNQLNRLKYNHNFFETLLVHQKQATATPDDLGILLGNPDATTRIIKVCSPYCDPCARAHITVDELLNQNQDIAVQIIFNATNREGDARNEPVKHLLSIYKNNDEAFFYHALDDWYRSDVKDYAAFARKYPLQDKLEQYNDKVNAMWNWCGENKIEFTPTFFINGNQLPAIYTPADLSYFLLSD